VDRRDQQRKAAPAIHTRNTGSGRAIINGTWLPTAPRKPSCRSGCPRNGARLGQRGGDGNQANGQGRLTGLSGGGHLARPGPGGGACPVLEAVLPRIWLNSLGPIGEYAVKTGIGQIGPR